MRIILLLLLTAGCKEKGIEVYEVARGERPAAPAAAARPERASPPAAVTAAPASAAGALAWTLPKGWEEKPGGGMRRATIVVPAGAAKLDLSVVVLPGPAGGELANVNRWRGQLGLGPAGDAGGERVKAPAGPVLLVEFPAPNGQALLGGILSLAEETWFFKMVGAAPAVSAARSAFLSFLASLKR